MAHEGILHERDTKYPLQKPNIPYYSRKERKSILPVYKWYEDYSIKVCLPLFSQTKKSTFDKLKKKYL